MNNINIIIAISIVAIIIAITCCCRYHNKEHNKEHNVPVDPVFTPYGAYFPATIMSVHQDALEGARGSWFTVQVPREMSLGILYKTHPKLAPGRISRTIPNMPDPPTWESDTPGVFRSKRPIIKNGPPLPPVSSIQPFTVEPFTVEKYTSSIAPRLDEILQTNSDHTILQQLGIKVDFSDPVMADMMSIALVLEENDIRTLNWVDETIDRFNRYDTWLDNILKKKGLKQCDADIACPNTNESYKICCYHKYVRHQLMRSIGIIRTNLNAIKVIWKNNVIRPGLQIGRGEPVNPPPYNNVPEMINKRYDLITQHKLWIDSILIKDFEKIKGLRQTVSFW